MTPELVRETLQVLEEAANAVKTHEFLIGSVSIALTEEVRGQIAEGLHVAAAKLENLRREILLAD